MRVARCPRPNGQAFLWSHINHRGGEIDGRWRFIPAKRSYTILMIMAVRVMRSVFILPDTRINTPVNSSILIIYKINTRKTRETTSNKIMCWLPIFANLPDICIILYHATPGTMRYTSLTSEILNRGSIQPKMTKNELFAWQCAKMVKNMPWKPIICSTSPIYSSSHVF